MLQKIRDKYGRLIKSNFLVEHHHVLEMSVVLLVLICSWVQFQFSCIYNSFTELFKIDMKYIFLNIVTNYVLFSIIFIIINTLWLSCIIFSMLTFLISVVNYYTIQLHASPLTVSGLGNFKTAFNVIGGYDLKLYKILPLLAVFILECILSFYLKRLGQKKIRSFKKIVIRDLGLCFVSVIMLFICYFMPASYMPQLRYWSWVVAYQEYGYMPCAIAAAYDSSLDAVKKPDGYEPGCVDSIEIERKDFCDNETPDIILILNETFYDLSVIIDLKTDVPYMENISSMENTIKGYAVNPAGGTNPSEYELLTSNSMKLMHGVYPFNMKDANSIVTHLKQIGYYTIGAHGSDSVNYNRREAYAAIGFDEIHFEEDFDGKEYYGDRQVATDESLYENLLTWYEQCDESPRFAFLLTIQNHGGWDLNKRDLDTVHAKNDFGEYDEEVDEFLSCIRLSDLAFKKFTDQLKDIDRDVSVCMVGDHGPHLTGKIPEDPESEQTLLLRTSVPFVIWANYDIEDRSGIDGRTISMNYLAPALLHTAGVSLTPYYNYMLDLKEETPILTAHSGYYDKSGNLYTYDSDSRYTEKVDNYLYLEYNNLQDDREQRLFDAYLQEK